METLQLISLELQRNGYSAVLIPWQINDNRHTVPDISSIVWSRHNLKNAVFQSNRSFYNVFKKPNLTANISPASNAGDTTRGTNYKTIHPVQCAAMAANHQAAT